MRTVIATTTLALATLLASVALPASAAEAPAEPAPDPAYAEGEVLVRYDGGRERLVELPAGVEVGDALATLRERPRVSYATPNYLARAAAVPNDPGQGSPADWRRLQWNFLPCGSLCGETSHAPFEARGGIDAVNAWDVLDARGVPGAKGVRIAILDTGIAYRSRRPNFFKSPDFSPKQFLAGLDAVKAGAAKRKGKGKGKKNGDGQLPLDRDGHGTHVAGTIAARTNNAVGVTGLAHRAKIIPVRVLDSQGIGTAHDIAKGIRYAAQNGADVINMSFEFSLAVSSCAKIKAVCKAIRIAARRGAVIVSAAGNSNGEPVAFPAGAPGVIGVGRTTKDGCLADQSRTGGGLDMVAPGGGLPLMATCGVDDPLYARGAPIFQLTFSGGGFRDFGYPAFYEGTSMAAAHVSGVAAMVVASGVVGQNPGPVTVECQLRGTARTSPDQLPQAYDPRTFGGGLVDAAAAVSARAPGC
jgi:serine protease